MSGVPGQVLRLGPPGPADRAHWPSRAALAVLAAARRAGVPVAEQAVLVPAVLEAAGRHPAATLLVTLTGRGSGRRLRAEFHDGSGGAAPVAVSAVAAPEGAAADPGEDGPLADARGLLDLLAEQRSRLDWYHQELDRTDRGTLELHAELVQTSERLRQAGEVQAHLLEAERQARATAESARARLSFLAHAGATLSASLDHAQILGRLHALLEAQQVARLNVWLDGDHPLAPFAVDGAPAPPRRPPETAHRAYLTGRAHHATPHPPLEVPELTGVAADTELLAVPLISRGRVFGVAAYAPVAAPFTADDVAVYGELTRVSAAALDNAMRYEYEHGVAQRLQEAMLTDLPAAGRLRFAARYLPAEAGLNVGGDWYDAFDRPDGHAVAAIGDVTGHGLRAATLMGQLRTALRAHALEAAAPDEVLTRMHRMLVQFQPDELASALLLQVAPGGRLRWANAGHPPPLLRGPDGRVRALRGSEPLLGAPVDPFAYRTRTAELAPGSTVLLYTDGLIERRERTLEVGLRRLSRVFAAATGGLEEVADAVLAEMLGDGVREDDTCLLLCGAVPARREGRDDDGHDDGRRLASDPA
ncbi:PP2C family protein-serine/threonine phosphatase [Actinomadura kijaniata]|uniref:PP2C family protein-serine/threonine phosphatase n=1 Tax=Actinomadura kijaniata TaxID=46161 RepID=UPI003F1A9180